MKTNPPIWLSALTASVILMLLGLIDWATGYEFSLFVFYFIPIALAAWCIGLGAALCFSVLCTAVWAAIDMLSGHVHSSHFYFYWNTMIRLTSFVIIGVAMFKIKEYMDRQHQLSEELKKTVAQLQKAMSEIKTLGGLLPICASCKKIRDDKGYWNQIESYIKEHSQASFTHGICPECMKKLYPDLYEEMQKEGKILK